MRVFIGTDHAGLEFKDHLKQALTDAGHEPGRREWSSLSGAEKRERLLAAAASVFSRQGLETPMSDVAGAVGAGVASVYRLYPSKYELYAALVVRRMDQIVDAARAIVDGHIILSRSLAEQGVYPAIDIGRSLSRVMTDIVSPEHAAAAAALRRLWSAFEENRDLILMGAYAPGNDPLIDEAIVRRPELLDFLTQAPDERASFADSVAALTGMMAQ